MPGNILDYPGRVIYNAFHETQFLEILSQILYTVFRSVPSKLCTYWLYKNTNQIFLTSLNFCILRQHTYRHMYSRKMYNCLQIVSNCPWKFDTLEIFHFDFPEIIVVARFFFFLFLSTKKRNSFESGKDNEEDNLVVPFSQTEKATPSGRYFEFHNVASTWEKKSAGLTNCPPRDIDGGLTAARLRVFYPPLFLNRKNEILPSSRGGLLRVESSFFSFPFFSLLSFPLASTRWPLLLLGRKKWLALSLTVDNLGMGFHCCGISHGEDTWEDTSGTVSSNSRNADVLIGVVVQIDR